MADQRRGRSRSPPRPDAAVSQAPSSPFTWHDAVWIKERDWLRTNPEFNSHGGRSPACIAYDTLYPHGQKMYQLPPNTLFGPVLAVHVLRAPGYIVAEVPHKDNPDFPVFINVSKRKARFCSTA